MRDTGVSIMKDGFWKSDRFIPGALSLALFLAVFLSYLPVFHNGFVNWDDPEAIKENPLIRDFGLSSLQGMFSTFHTGNWIPLDWLSLALDYQIGGLNPVVYHLNNLLLHGFNTVLFFFLAYRILGLAWKNHDPAVQGLSKGRSLAAASLAALLFGLHPIHVESVAWATERKDVLCGFFYLLSLGAYLRWAGAAEGRRAKAALCLAFFVLAVMAKPMAVTLPAAMLVLDVWPLGRLPAAWRTALLEKIPFFLAALVFSALAVAAQAQWGALSPQGNLGLPFRAMNAFHSLAFYLGKMILPVHLLPYYPLVPGSGAFSLRNLGAALVVALVSWVCFSARRTRPYWGAAWLFYLAALAPVLGVLQVGDQAAADRYTYLPSLGPCLLLGTWAVLSLRKNIFLVFLVCLMAAGGLGTLTWRQTGLWKDSVTLWESAAKAHPDDSQIIHSNLANAYRAAGRPDDAVAEYDRAIAIGPPKAFPHDGKGVALLDKGLAEEAIREFQAAVALDPQDLPAHRHLFLLYQKLGRNQEAEEEFQEAARLAPGSDGAEPNPGTGAEK
jgi:hypothetical protein